MLSIPIKLDVSAERAEKALRDFFNGVEDALDGIVDLNGTVINFDVNMRKTGDDVVKALNETDAATKKVTNSAKKYDQGVENSIKRAKFRVQQAKKEREAIDATSKAYADAGLVIKGLESKVRSLQGVQGGSVADIKSQRAELVALRDATKINTPEFKRLTKEIKKFDKQLDSSKVKGNSFVTAFAKIAIVTAGIQAVGSALRSVTNTIDAFVRRTKEVEGFTLALSNAGLEQAEVSRVFQQAETTANALGAPLAQVEKTYKRMIPALRAVGTSSADSDKFIEQISARTQTLGLNTEQSGRLLEAFAQVLSKGKLQAEELNQQISELDGAFRVQFAEALGVSTEALNDLISNSKITADVFVETVNKMANGADLLKKRIEDGTATIQQFQNQIGNIDIKNIEVIGAAIEPAIKSFLQIRLAVAEFVSEFTKTAQFENLVIVFNGLAKGAEIVVKLFLQLVKAVQQLTAPLLGIINSVLSLGDQFGGLVGILTVLTAAILAKRVALDGLFKAGKGIDYLVQQFVNLKTAVLGAKGPTAKYGENLVDVSDKAKKAGHSLKDLGKAAVKVAAAFVITAAINSIVESFQAAGKGAKEMSANFATIKLDFKDKLEELNGELEKTPETTEKYTRSLKDSVQAQQNVAATGATLGNSIAVVGAGIVLAGAAAVATGGTALPVLAAGLGKVAAGGALAAGGLALAAKHNKELQKSGAGREFLKDQEEIGDLVKENEKELSKLGVTVGMVDFSSFADSGDDVVEASRRLQAQEAIIRGNISALEGAIRKEKEKENGNQSLIASAKHRIKVEKDNLLLTTRSANAASAFVTELLKQGDATTGAAINTEELASATDEFIGNIDSEVIKAQTKAIQKYGKEANAAELLAAANIGIAAAATEEKIDIYNKEIQKLNEVKETQGVLTAKQSARQKELTDLIAQETNKQAQLSLDAQAAVIAGFEQGVERVNQKVATIGETASALQGSFDNTTSTFVSGLQAATGLIDQVVSREIEGLEVGSKKRKDIILEQLRAQALAITTENELAKLKLSVQSQVAQSEARIQQGQLQVLAAQARMSGNEGLAQSLDAAAAAQNDIIAALQLQERVEKRILDINKQTQQQALIDKGLKEQVGRSAEDVANKVGVQVVNLKEAKKEQQAVKRLAEEYSKKMATAATNAQDLKEQTQKTAMKEGTDNAGKIADALDDADGAAEGLNTVMNAVNSTFINVANSGDRIKTTLQDAITEANTLIKLTGGNARAMGGPVTGGQQYTVNDGGGREAFLSNTGKFSMLPAARNIQWTAPSSGTIISAKVLKAMQRNQGHNGVISNARVDQGPAPKLMAATAMTSDSGSLAKQITTAMSGSTANRITNNVTIQSQSPVNDASDLMTNVARMRLRNSRRF